MQPFSPLQVLELFSGVGGWRYALGDLGRVVAAFDISPAANATYELNHGDRPQARELGRVKIETLSALGADTWLLSPPCQPFCRMGRHQGLEDRRSLAFLHLMEVLRQAPPRHLALENVEGFLGSDAHDLLARRLEEGGFHRLDYRLCPSRFGLPNLRPRVFILASRNPLRPAPLPDLPPVAVGAFLDEVEDPGLYLKPEDLARHGPGLDLAKAEATRTACFIGGYGQRFVGSGSFLETARGVRRFSPMEVARLMGLPGTFRFPADLGLEQRYRLLGNGLSQPVARWALAQMGLAACGGGS
jgi:DNA (cytosine-5)-methyltransferase 1/tRNA (cytosine38-C5)-methyltransferase